MTMSQVEFVSNLNMYSTANKMRLSGIVCTIGPVSREPATLLELIENGMNVARMNFSHGYAVKCNAKSRLKPGSLQHSYKDVCLQVPRVPRPDDGELQDGRQDVQGEARSGSQPCDCSRHKGTGDQDRTTGGGE